jgi:hypothetical protein
LSLDPFFKRAFGDDQPTSFGSGWASGVSAVVCGVLGLGGVLCFHFPALLTAPGLRAQYPIELLRGLLQAVILAAFVLALLSALRRKRKVLALTGVSLGTLATLLGGASVPLPEQVDGGLALGATMGTARSTSPWPHSSADLPPTSPSPTTQRGRFDRGTSCAGKYISCTICWCMSTCSVRLMLAARRKLFGPF